MELTAVEEFFIEVYRNFSFLRQCNYEGIEFSSEGREMWVSFFNPQNRIKITIVMEEPFVLNVYFERKKIFNFSRFELRNYYDQLGAKYLEKNNIVKTVALFIRQNLMPIIRGEKWIDDMIKKL